MSEYYAKVRLLDGQLILSGRGYGWTKEGDWYVAKSLIPHRESEKQKDSRTSYFDQDQASGD